MFGPVVRLAVGCSLAFALALSLGVSSASADIINFEQFLGPVNFVGAGPNQVLIIPTSVGDVIFTGGLVLTEAASVPANQTSIYGTAFFAETQSPAGTIVVTFPQNINNFFLNLYNGFVLSDTFTISDNAGNSVSSTLDPTSLLGTTLVSFPAAGSVVTITTSNTFWDFFIDDVGFNEATPGTLPPPPPPTPTTVPEPGTITLLASAGMIGVVARLRRRRQLASQKSH